jgi:hypothetical protein
VAFHKTAYKRYKAVGLIILPAFAFIFIFGWSLYWIGLQRAIKERETSRMGNILNLNTTSVGVENVAVHF